MTALAASTNGLRTDPPRRSARFWRFVAVSVGLHLVLIAIFVLLSLQTPERPPPPQPMDVTIADDVGLKAAAPQNLVPPAQSRAPVLDKPQEAPPPAPAEQAPEPTPPRPQPRTAPPPRPAEVAKPQPKKAAPPTKTEKTRAKPTPPAQEKPSKTPAKAKGKGDTADARQTRASGASLGDIMKGISPEKSTSTSRTPKAAAMSQKAMMDIGQVIQQQIQPCAARQSLTAPGVSRMRVLVNLRLNRDGSPAAAPRVLRVEGVDKENARYEDQVRDRALAAFQDRRCQPLHGLPADLYDVPSGWSSFTLRFRLPG